MTSPTDPTNRLGAEAVSRSAGRSRSDSPAVWSGSAAVASTRSASTGAGSRILRPDRGAIERDVLDPTPRRVAHISQRSADGAPRLVWTTGDETICCHDLVGSLHVQHSVQPSRPSDFVVVPAARTDYIESDWFIGLVHDPSAKTTDLRVRDAADITDAVATIRLPRPLTSGLRCTWLPAAEH